MARSPLSIDDKLRALACHGVVSWREANRAGIHHSRLARRVGSGRMRSVARGVFLIPDAADDLTPVAVAQARFEGAVAIRSTGAFVARLDGLDRAELLPAGVADHPELLVPRRPHRIPPNVVIGEPSPRDVASANGLRVLRALPLLRSLGEVLDADGLEAVVEDLLRDGKVGEADVWALVPRSPALQQVIDRRPLGTPCTGSYAETLAMQRVFRPARLSFERQVPVSAGPRPIAVLDFLLEGCLFVEINSLSHHSSRHALRRDSWHAGSVRLAGLEVETLWWDDVTRLAGAVGRRLRERISQIRGEHMFGRLSG